MREPAPQLWSNCMVVGDVAYVSGMTARGPDGQTVIGDDEYQQSKVIFQKIKDLVIAAGGHAKGDTRRGDQVIAFALPD